MATGKYVKNSRSSNIICSVSSGGFVTRELFSNSLASSWFICLKLIISFWANWYAMRRYRIVNKTFPLSERGIKSRIPSFPRPDKILLSILSTTKNQWPAATELRCFLTSFLASSYSTQFGDSNLVISLHDFSKFAMLRAYIQKTDHPGILSLTQKAISSANCVLPTPPSPNSAMR